MQLNRTLRVTNEMAKTGLSNKEMQELIINIGQYLKASNLKETTQMEVIRDINEGFNSALDTLGVFD